VRVAVRQNLREGQQRRDGGSSQLALQYIPVALDVAPLHQLRQVLLQVATAEIVLGALAAHRAAAGQHLPQPLPVGCLCRRVAILGDHDLAGAELDGQHLQLAEVLIVGELAGAHSAASSIQEGHAHLAVAVHVLQGDGHDDGGVQHVVVSEEVLLEGAQLAGGGGP